MTQRVSLLLLLILLAVAGAAHAQDNWSPTGLYTGNFITAKQCQSSGGGSYIMASSGTSVYRSLDTTGVSWQDVSAYFGGRTVYCFYSYSPSFLTYATLAGTSAGLFRSLDGGATWALLDNGVPTNIAIYDMYTPGAGYILLGTNDGIYQSGSYTAFWTHLATPGAGVTVYSFTSWMLYGQSYNYCGTSTGIWRSDGPYGNTWYPQDGGGTSGRLVLKIQNLGSNTVAAVWDPGPPLTGLGVYKAPNSAAWVTANTGLGNLSVNGLAINPNRCSTLYIGTPSSNIKF